MKESQAYWIRTLKEAIANGADHDELLDIQMEMSDWLDYDESETVIQAVFFSDEYMQGK